MESKDWINNVINSTQGSQRATPSKDLFYKIEKRLNPFSISLAMAASIALLVLNFFIIKNYIDQDNSTEPGSSQETIISNYNFYGSV